MKKIITMMLILAFAVGICLAQNVTVWEENFNSNLDLPAGWVDNTNYGVEVVAGIGVGGTNALKFHAYWLPSGDYDDLILAGPVIEDIPANATLSFEYRIMSPGSTTAAGNIGAAWFTVYVVDPTISSGDALTYVDETHVSSASYATVTLSLADYEDMSGRILIEIETQSTSDNFDVHLDNFKITAPPGANNDLRALSVTGNPNPRINEPNVYTVTVKNMGVATVAGSAYTVSLYRVDATDELLETVNGVEIAGTSNSTFDFTVTFADDVQEILYGTVNIASDPVQANNQTPDLHVSVRPEGFVYIGDGASESRTAIFPFYLWYRQSLAQTIYYEDELLPGYIESIGYNFTRGGDAPGSGGYPEAAKPVKIWMKVTDREDFSSFSDFEPYTGFTLVYDGTIPINVAGNNDITLPLISPFFYDGGNLIVMTQKLHEGWEYSNQNTWLATATPGIARTIIFRADGNNVTADIATAYPTFNATNTPLYAAIPNTFMQVGSFTAVLSGTVTDEDTTDPIQGVQISIDDTAIRAYSDGDGDYSLAYITGTYDITATKHGYYDVHEADIDLTDDATETFDFTMEAIPTVTVTGTILASDTATTGIEGATVTLTGYDDYTATTQAGGTFSIPGVYVDQTYTITVSATRYLTYTDEVEITEASHAIATITLTERRNPPQNVVATSVATGMSIAWDIPSTNVRIPSRSFIAEPVINDTDPHTRALTGYNIYRTTLANQANEANWVEVTTNAQASPYVDTAWLTVDSGDYKYAVKAVYTGSLESDATFSNTVVNGATVTVEVSTSDEASATGAIVRLVNNNNNPDMIYQATVTANDMVTLENVSFGSYTVTVSLTGYSTYTDADIAIGSNPYNLSATLSRVYVLLSANFDNLQLPTGWRKTSNSAEANNQWVFTANTGHQNAGGLYPAHNNSAGMANSRSYDGDNDVPLSPDNWLITPQLSISSVSIAPRLEYYVATWAGNSQEDWRDSYGVYLSTTGTAPADFNVTLVPHETPPGGHPTAPVWTLKTANLTPYIGQNIYIAFRHHNSANGFYLMIDDVTVYAQGTVGIGDETTPIAQTALHTNYPNPFNPTTTISFDVARESNVSIDVYNIKGQKVKTLTNEVFGVGSHYVVWNGDDHNGRNVSSGVYFYRMTTEGYTKTQKMLLMK